MLIGYSQPVLTGMVASLTHDITTFGGEEEYSELDAYLAFLYNRILLPSGSDTCHDVRCS